MNWNKLRTTLTRGAAVAACAGACGAAQAASTSATACADVFGIYCSSQNGTVEAFATRAGPADYGRTYTATAQAEPGVLRATVGATSEDAGGQDARAIASFQDDVQFVLPPGTTTFNVTLGLALNGDCTGAGGNISCVVQMALQAGRGHNVLTLDLLEPGRASGTLTLAAGDDLPLSGYLDLRCHASYGHCEADFSHTGLVSLLSATPGVSFYSNSGHSYVPVPEPASSLLWLAGMAALWAAVRHRGLATCARRPWHPQGFALLLALCGGAASAAGAERADLESSQANAAPPAAGAAACPRSLAYGFARRDTLVSAAAGDSHLVFVTQPLTASVAVLDRFSGQPLGELPPPPGGWLLPFSLRVPREGHVVVLDSGGFPSPTTPSVPRVYDYRVFYNPHTLQLQATLERIVRFDGLPLVFAEDVEVTPSGHYVVSESIVGALWVIRPDGSIAPGLFPSDGQPIATLAPCAFTPTTVGGLPFTTAGNFAPGVVGLAEHGGQLYFSTTCHGGVYRVPMASLLDATRSPAARAADIRPVSPRAAGTASETLHGLAFDRARPGDDALYAADSLQLRIVRVDTRDGSRQVVASDPVLFNFPSKLQFLPPVNGLAPLLVASDQEHRIKLINAALQQDELQPPWLVTKVYVGPPDGPHHPPARP